ncbi:MAG: DNA-directed RNA polymerase subunit beta, partial [Chloroflexota bacterium]|nr:DNA-directed RNA polymerase subunit beta [Chloroflexota bacterium]
MSVPARSYARIPQVLDMPHLVEMQTNSFRWFLAEALRELFAEISPIQDFTGAKYELSFLEHEFRDPKYSLQECRDKEITYSAPLYVKTQLKLKEKSDETKEQWIFAGDVPMMTPNGTFMVNGAERVVVSQLVRSPGVYFTTERDPASDRELCYAKLIPYRGAWLEFETSTKDIVSVKVDRKRKVSATTFLTALGMASEEDVMAPFKGVDTDETHKYMQTTLEKDPLSDEWDHTFKEDGLKTVWEA